MDSDLPDFMSHIKKVDENDKALNAALLRDYMMLGSAYILEPCHLSYLATNNYGEGMSYMPEKIAVPMKFLCDRV